MALPGPLLRIDKLRFGYDGYGNVLHLDQFSLEAQSNILVIGPSGCGKTTLLHLIAGLLVPSSGSIVVEGQNLAALSARARDRFRGRHIGIVLQQFHLLPTLTAIQNLLVAQSIAGLPVNRAAALVILNDLGVDERVDAYPHQLSVGQQQRVAIARALVNRPKLKMPASMSWMGLPLAPTTRSIPFASRVRLSPICPFTIRTNPMVPTPRASNTTLSSVPSGRARR